MEIFSSSRQYGAAETNLRGKRVVYLLNIKFVYIYVGTCSLARSFDFIVVFTFVFDSFFSISSSVLITSLFIVKLFQLSVNTHGQNSLLLNQ